MTMLDALVIGKGPAGLAAAAELSVRGLRTAVAGPPGIDWPAVYGAWEDDLAAAGCPGVVENRWTRVTVDAGQGARVLGRTYARIDNRALAALLVGRCDRGGTAWIDGEVRALRHLPASTAATLADGREVEARVVVDASGARTKLVERDRSPEPAYQTAVGWTLETDRHPWAPDEAVLMDWTDRHLPAAERGKFASFLYAFPLGNGRVFVEETVLAGRPAVGPDALRARLEHRLRHLGIDAAARVGGEERVWIPMGGALPKPQRTVGFGAAAAMVHPATGYSVARSLAAAPALAEAVQAGLSRSDASPRLAARMAWDAVWPAERRRKQALYRFGMEALLGFTPAETRTFFASFFDLPAEDWGGYLSDRLGARELAGVMARFFAAAPAGVRSVLTRGALSPAGRELAAALIF